MSLKAEKINYIYNEGTALESYAVKDVSFEINEGEFVGIIGRTGSGKSTLIQHLNGLLKATRGDLIFNGESIYRKGYDIKKLRQQVGLVFQYPEYQLFENDIISDVMFGPLNCGLSRDEAKDRADEALQLVGIDSSLYGKSPFEISGGQKRRAAIAGVLAMHPRYLVLDEPTAGLDPKGRDEILGKISELKKATGMAVILVSHSMEDVAEHVERLMVMHDGKLEFDSTPRDVFSHYKELETMGLAAPQMVYVTDELRKAGFDLPEGMITVDEVVARLKPLLKQSAN